MANMMHAVAAWTKGTRTGKWVLAAVAAAPMLAAMPNTAKADSWDRRDDRHDRRDDDRHDRDRHDDDHRGGGLNLDFRIGERPPQYVERGVQVWVPAVYRTEC